MTKRNYFVIYNKLNSFIEINKDSTKDLIKLRQDIGNYLNARHYYFEPQIIQNVDKNELLNFANSTLLEDMNPIQIEAKTVKLGNDPISYSMFQLSKLFGYEGDASLDSLKTFFNEEKKGERGVYWNGKEWVVNEAGLERDDKMGNNGEDTLRKIIDRIALNSYDVLEARTDAIVDLRNMGIKEVLHQQALRIVSCLEKGYSKWKEAITTK